MVTLDSESNTSIDGTLELDPIDMSAETETCIDELVSSLPGGKTRSIPPTNYVRVSKWGSPVGGQYVLNLSLPPPPPPSSSADDIHSDADPKNLSLHTTSGPIDTEIWIIHDGSGQSKRVSLDLRSDNGLVHAKVHDPSSPDGNSRARPSLDIELHANYGDISVSLPRCFRGPITIRTGDERVAFSPALEECTALLSDVRGVQVYFVGDRPFKGKWGIHSGNDGRGYSLDEPLDELSAGGRYTSVRINWDGEEELPSMWPGHWQTFCSGAEIFFTTGRVC